MIESVDLRAAPRPLCRRLMVGGLGFWGVSVGGAMVPGVLRAAFYPNHAGPPRFELVAADALGAPFLWSAFVCWCISWALVVGYVPAAWAALQARRKEVSLALLLLLSLASPLVFAFAITTLLRLATRGAVNADGVLPFLPAVLVQLVVSLAYSVLTGVRPGARLPRTEGA